MISNFLGIPDGLDRFIGRNIRQRTRLNILHDNGIKTEMSSFWRNLRCLMHWRLSVWQLSVHKRRKCHQNYIISVSVNATSTVVGDENFRLRLSVEWKPHHNCILQYFSYGHMIITVGSTSTRALRLKSQAYWPFAQTFVQLTRKKTLQFRVIGLCEWNQPVTGGSPQKGPATRKCRRLMTSSWNSHVMICSELFKVLMGWVIEVRLPCYLVLLSVDSKTR